MKYYLIAGEASGDLHASHLMAALKNIDTHATFRGYGGDMMQAQGADLVGHYRDMAYMGILPVLLHARTILNRMSECKQDIMKWWPDVVILVDYPGFNLKIAHYVKQHTRIPVFYYISPKIWAWKEYRIKAIRRDVDELFSILPFEVDFFEKKHHYPIHYVGNPSVDEVAAFKQQYVETHEEFCRRHNTSSRPIIALLPGSRRQEIEANLPRMLKAVEPFTTRYQILMAVAPGISWNEVIRPILHAASPEVEVRGIFNNDTYALLSHSTAALVTSGTATLETALFRVPQVVCYYMKAGRLASLGRRLILKIPYISLVNLIAEREVVPELVADGMTPANVHRHLAAILPGGKAREAQLQGYEEMTCRLGTPGAPQRAARLMVERLSRHT